MASVEARKTPERLMRAQEAKNKHQLFFERVENEVNLNFPFSLIMLKLCVYMFYQNFKQIFKYY